MLSFCPSPDSCQLGRAEGPCLGMVTRFFYNGSSMACETFQYGGCLGNKNNFASEKECLQTCRTVGERGPRAAAHAAAPGPCSQQATRKVDGEQGGDVPAVVSQDRFPEVTGAMAWDWGIRAGHWLAWAPGSRGWRGPVLSRSRYPGSGPSLGVLRVS